MGDGTTAINKNSTLFSEVITLICSLTSLPYKLLSKHQELRKHTQSFTHVGFGAALTELLFSDVLVFIKMEYKELTMEAN